MHDVMRWAAYVGGWLLFAGPIFQAAIELREIAFDRGAFADAGRRAAERVPPPSPWWWLLPPVAVVLAHRHEGDQRAAAWASLGEEHRGPALAYATTAHGWVIVAGGAFLIALKETWELVDHQEWGVATFVLLSAAGALAAVANTATAMARARRMAEAMDSGDGPAGS